MATATKKARSAGRPTRAGRPMRVQSEVRGPEAMGFVVFEDNGGNYHWTIVASTGETLALSGSFGCRDDAEKAAKHVRDGAASALLASPAPEALPGAERGIDESGAFSSAAVVKWSAQH